MNANTKKQVDRAATLAAKTAPEELTASATQYELDAFNSAAIKHNWPATERCDQWCRFSAAFTAAVSTR